MFCCGGGEAPARSAPCLGLSPFPPPPGQVVYEVAQPVTVRAGESALVPVMEKAIQGERVLQFDFKKNEACLGWRTPERSAGLQIFFPLI